MPRTYKPRSKRHRVCDQMTIDEAVLEYKTSKCSLAEIGAKYNIAKSVLHRHSTRTVKKRGGQTVLNAKEEEYIIGKVNHCSEMGYKLSAYDLRTLVKGYLDMVGRKVRHFKGNLPGPDFVYGFFKRHENKLLPRLCRKYKRLNRRIDRALTPDSVKDLYSQAGEIKFNSKNRLRPKEETVVDVRHDDNENLIKAQTAGVTDALNVNGDAKSGRKNIKGTKEERVLTTENAMSSTILRNTSDLFRNDEEIYILYVKQF